MTVKRPLQAQKAREQVLEEKAMILERIREVEQLMDENFYLINR